MLLNECIENILDRACPVFTENVFVETALALMQESGYDCAPVLHDGKIKAMVTIKDLLSSRQVTKINEMPLSELKIENVESIGLHEHLFDIFSRIRLFPLSLIPVLKEDGTFEGMVEKVILLEYIAAIFHLGEDGITLELEVPSSNLKLSEVIATLEKNDVTILSFGMYSLVPQGEAIVLAFRLHTHDLFRLEKNLEKYGYLIRYTSPFFKEKDADLREKALEFIHYMDL